MKFSAIVSIMLGVLPHPGQVAHAHQQISVKEGSHKFKLSRFDDGRTTPYRISFWDDSLTGSSYRFDEYGYISYFKAGSKVYYDVHYDNNGALAFSVKEESEVEKKKGNAAEMRHGGHHPSCSQCSRMFATVCSYGSLPGFCHNVVSSSLGTDDGTASVNILCHSADDICTSVFDECESLCASEFPTCTHEVLNWIGDGMCDGSLNNPECGYDGGDCGDGATTTTSDQNRYDDDDDYNNECDVEFMACIDDLHCSQCLENMANNDNYCYNTPQDDESCSSKMDYMCCLAGESCSDDALLVDMVGCMAEVEGCHMDGGICDTTADDEHVLGGDGNGYYVEARMNTDVSVTASGYDERSGSASGGVGCGDHGCMAVLAYDGVHDDDESRWSCAEDIVPDREQCELTFTFDSPQSINHMEVVFWKGDEGSRTFKVTIDGEKLGEYDSQPGSMMMSVDVSTEYVHTVTIESLGLEPDEWISILEVYFMVEPNELLANLV